MASTPKSPSPKLDDSNTSECEDPEDAFHDIEDHDDLFERCVSIRKETKLPLNKSRASTMRGFVVNTTMMLKLYIDETNYVTIPIRSDTKAKDAIQTIITRRNIPSHTQCKLYRDDVEIDNDANLHEIMQLLSGSNQRIQVRFETNPLFQDKIDENHHLFESIKSDDDSLFSPDDDDESSHTYSPYSPYRPRTKPKHKKNSKKRKKLRQKNRASPSKMNLIAFYSLSVHQQSMDDGTDIHRDELLQNIEHSLKQLPRQQFNVTKVNKYGQHQKRMLKLTAHGIENIKPGKKGRFRSSEDIVTSFHLWENVTNSYLEDSKTIRISYRDYKDGDRKYQSSDANTINESIQQRLKIIRDQKIAGNRKEISVEFQKIFLKKQAAAAKIFNVADHVRLTRNRSGYIVYKGYVHFAPGTHYGIELDSDDMDGGQGDHDGFYDGIRYFKTKPMKAVIVPRSHIIRKIAMQCEQTMDDEVDKMVNAEERQLTSPWKHDGGFFGVESIEDTIYKQIKALILATDTNEGRNRIHFTNKFSKYAKEENLLEMVRDFMDAVKDKILEKHGQKYSDLIYADWHKDDDTKEMTEDEKVNELTKLADVLNKLIESAIEQTILQAKIKEIYKICLDQTKSECQILSLKVDKLRHRTQEYFGIKKELESTTNWNTAVYELSLLRDCALPSEKINTLVNCAHAIYLSHAKERREKEKVVNMSMSNCHNDKTQKKKRQREEYFITGDDFLPIVIYVIIQASKQRLCITDADLLFMEGLVDPKMKTSEPGYYLAVFHAALQWIRCFNN